MGISVDRAVQGKGGVVHGAMCIGQDISPANGRPLVDDVGSPKTLKHVATSRSAQRTLPLKKARVEHDALLGYRFFARVGISSVRLDVRD